MSLVQEGRLQLAMESELASASSEPSSKQTKNQTTAESRTGALRAGNTYARAISVFLKFKPKGWACLSVMSGGAGLVCWAWDVAKPC